MILTNPATNITILRARETVKVFLKTILILVDT